MAQGRDPSSEQSIEETFRVLDDFKKKTKEEVERVKSEPSRELTYREGKKLTDDITECKKNLDDIESAHLSKTEGVERRPVVGRGNRDSGIGSIISEEVRYPTQETGEK